MLIATGDDYNSNLMEERLAKVGIRTKQIGVGASLKKKSI